MKYKINNQLTLYFKKFFPCIGKIDSYNYKYIVTIGIGGNIGNVPKRFKQLFDYMLQDNSLQIIQTSPILKNPPFGYLEQNDFLNAIIVFNTNLNPFLLLNKLQQYENKFGRKRSFKDAPRTLDIDIIFIKQHHKNLNINHPRLKVPHPCFYKRESVLIPLTQIMQ